MPEAVTNNAVAKVDTSQGSYLLSFMGLGAKKSSAAVHNKVWALNINPDGNDSKRLNANVSQWQAKSPVPSSLPQSGRLASIAVGVDGMAYIFGGYTVDQAHNEVSSPDNFRYDVVTDTYYPISATPVAVDDAIALVYHQRYVYLISGWHNDGNVNLVQIYDVKTDTWQQGSPFLGQPVFGHAGAIVAEDILLCDGVKVDVQPDKRRTFSAQRACYHGKINKDEVHKIDWRSVEHPNAAARYRMAAVGDSVTNSAIFVGGSDNPYNYDGIGYNGEPAKPSKQIWRYDFSQAKWTTTEMNNATMDHRGLLPIGEGDERHFVTLGGMVEHQKVSSAVTPIVL
ncbi:galactose oxidase [Paraglaciecola sp. 20A4]|uniref:Kelch repeat-containing protein n=1 Tax=Paraglaciecola sp. 20A4 TaxID=2687288 RepID=UPI001409DE84|nr:galactose oxidase [Paraglaciecola sp. 20A4]